MPTTNSIDSRVRETLLNNIKELQKTEDELNALRIELVECSLLEIARREELSTKLETLEMTRDSHKKEFDRKLIEIQSRYK